MRIRRSDAQDDSWSGKTLAVKVEIIEADVTGAKTKADWIGLERSYGAGPNTSDKSKYCDGTGELGASSAGKRKYFTTDLTTSESELARTAINELIGTDGFSQKGGQMVIVPVTAAGECVWIYVDECDEDIANDEARTEASTDLQAVRKATIRVTNGYLAENKSFLPLQEGVYDYYIINQHKLYKVTYGSNTYCIEHEEEYLYNFDSEDTYTDNQTEFEGMAWGLDGAQLSFDHQAMYASSEGEISSSVTKIVNDLVKEKSPFYDFYLSDDIRPEEAEVHSRAGYDFTKEIISDINNTNRNTNTNYTIGALALDAKPRCAIEYCYNRNKRNADGTITASNIKWYMPSIDELQDIVSAAYSDFEVFQNKFYWSCQPAYTPRYLYYEPKGWSLGIGQRHGSFAIDNVNSARATRAVYRNGEYTYDASGASGYYDVFHIINEWKLSDNISTKNTSTPFTHSYMGDSWTAPAIFYQPGYFSRTRPCRVRAVRKMN